MTDLLRRNCTNKYVALYLDADWAFRGCLEKIVDSVEDGPVAVLRSANGAYMYINVSEIKACTMSARGAYVVNPDLTEQVPNHYSPDRRPVRPQSRR